MLFQRVIFTREMFLVSLHNQCKQKGDMTDGRMQPWKCCHGDHHFQSTIKWMLIKEHHRQKK